MISGFRRWRRWLVEGVSLFVIVGLLHAFTTRGTVSGEAPGLSGVTLDGRPVSLADLRGQPVLVHFWATWCPVCGLEQGGIDALAGKRQVLTVAMEDTPADAIRRYMADKSVDYPVLHDPGFEHAARWGVSSVPASFIVDPEGRIRFTEVGYTTGLGLQLRLWWASL
jgi:peroxiredoxin